MQQELEVGILVLLRNSAKDGRKGDKLAKRWLGPYIIEESVGKGVYQLLNVQLVEPSEKSAMDVGKYDVFLTCSYNYV